MTVTYLFENCRHRERLQTSYLINNCIENYFDFLVFNLFVNQTTFNIASTTSFLVTRQDYLFISRPTDVYSISFRNFYNDFFFKMVVTPNFNNRLCIIEIFMTEQTYWDPPPSIHYEIVSSLAATGRWGETSFGAADLKVW